MSGVISTDVPKRWAERWKTRGLEAVGRSWKGGNPTVRMTREGFAGLVESSLRLGDIRSSGMWRPGSSSFHQGALLSPLCAFPTKHVKSKYLPGNFGIFFLTIAFFVTNPVTHPF